MEDQAAKLARNRVEFTLNDVYGESHEYVSVKLTGSKGLSILLRLLKIGVPAVGGSVSSLSSFNIGSLVNELKGGLTKIVSVEDDGTGGVGDVEIDTEKLTQALASLVDGVISLGGESMIREILGDTYRDGKELGKSHTFDVAYQGNFMEMFSAIMKVLSLNFAPFLTAAHSRG